MAVALAVGVFACANDPTAGTPQDFARQLTGRWAEQVGVPGSSLVMDLTVQSTVVSGTGTYSIAAGRSGSLVVEGVISGTNALLVITFDSGDYAHFNGVITAPHVLSGAFWEGPPPVDPIVVSFHKILL